MPHYQVILFDFDGTLCATQASIIYTFQKTFAQRGAPIPTEEAIIHGITSGVTLVEFLPFLYPPLLHVPPTELQDWVQHYRNLYSQEGAAYTTLFPGAKALLQQLRQQGLVCVVLSNKGQQAIEEALAHFGLASNFDLVIGDNPALPLPKKPDPAAFLQVIQPRYPHVPPSGFLMVGDTQADLAFAQNAGIDACWAAFGYGDVEACHLACPKFTIDELGQLLALV
ncbi:HAD family hydrolase [Rufibacter sp. LB8]|uniref:HAD family hydrolase n=1 Tax=Rufibacter sp. LB8 TaxID=2777781 RepID=UPI00178C6EA7|nr:HAD family hydrolase [Rufibacter sp. LB8]